MSTPQECSICWAACEKYYSTAVVFFLGGGGGGGVCMLKRLRGVFLLNPVWENVILLTPFLLACMYSMCMYSTCWHACVCQCSTSCALACMEYVYCASTHDDWQEFDDRSVGKSLQKFDLDEWRCQLFKKICLDLITQMVEWEKYIYFPMN